MRYNLDVLTCVNGSCLRTVLMCLNKKKKNHSNFG